MAVMTFISSLPIRKIGGIGKVTEHILRDAFGISTCEEMLQKGGLLCALFSHSTADFFLSVSLGIGKTDTPQVRSRKSISSERTFSATDDETLLYQKLADIAEMLCADMKKGGLCGRTLTLKLKTASFEVRSRAVTLEKYIGSNEDILKYASKLLKAELPISLRLMGLRLSHFNEDNIGAPSDPTQKTLNNFIVSGDLSRKNLDDPKSLGLDINDQHLMNNMEGSFSIESHELQHYGIRDPLDSNNLQDLNVHHCTYTDSVEAEKIHEPSSNKIADKVITKDMAGEVSQRKESGLSLPGQLEGASPDRMNWVIMDNEAVFSSEQKDGLVWVDDYKCSLCGIEMPPHFDEERQEHSDFHLAERLQKDESIMDSRTSTPRQRSVQKDHISSQSKRKKRKPSPKEGGHLSIDMFFAKSNQNF